jgi:hypothetical protein
MVATLLKHEEKPLPQWPQIININSIISLFSLLIRAGVGVVLAEGVFFFLAHFLACLGHFLTTCRDQPVKVAMVPRSTRSRGHGSFRLSKSWRMGFGHASG